MDLRILQEQCSRTLVETQLDELGEREEGKVRDNYKAGKQRFIVVTDRISCFDVVVGSLPFKGQVLNQIAAFWFDHTQDIAPNHLLEVPDPCVSVVRECSPLPVEFIYRGYLTGSTSTSIWTAYERGERDYCGHTLPDGLHKHEQLPEPLLTPTTKAPRGQHDELASRSQLLEGGSISEGRFDEAAALCAALFKSGQAWAAQRGLILVDTKYELGIDEDGKIIVIDEIHTPDSSRYWYSNAYAKAMSEGADPQALDKEYLRRWLGDQGYQGHGAIPAIPDDVRCEAARRYIEAYETLTGLAFEPDTEPAAVRIRRNLGLEG
ncbi:MAG: phosphoribosylaminoimidazolesuccinocarboxamide synthase [Deltaproteobacteria bacterium]|nr:MAG: phosphoribosylaminoimidazolesuccinocarboxamide synthase [Deltaproteobacteria bacterium]